MGIRKFKTKTNSKRRNSTKSKSLVDALFTSTQQRVLGLFFGQPERRFFATEIIGLAHIGSGTVQRELAALVESGLVSVEQVGKQKHYQANRNSPIFEELCRITLKTMGLAEPVKRALMTTGALIKFAMIYGSVAKGTAKAGSDVDLLVVSDDMALEELYAALEPVEKTLARKISPTLYTIDEFTNRVQSKNSFLGKITSGDRIVLIGDENALTATG